MDVQKQKEKTEQSKLTFARNLKRYMEMKGAKTGDVARVLDIPYNTVLDWINGKRYPQAPRSTRVFFYSINKSKIIQITFDNGYYPCYNIDKLRKQITWR